METNDDKIQYIKVFAKELILHYLKNNLKDVDQINKQTERINKIFDEAIVEIHERIRGINIRW